MGVGVGRHYTEQQIKEGLMAMVCCTHAKAARQFLVEQTGLDIPEGTLQTWVHVRHVEQYERLREEWAPQIERRVCSSMLDNARRIVEVERMAIEAAHDELASGKAEKPAQIARDLSQVKSQSIDKRLALEGRPRSMADNRSADEILGYLVRRGLAEVIDSDAEEIEEVDDGRVEPPLLAE